MRLWTLPSATAAAVALLALLVVLVGIGEGEKTPPVQEAIEPTEVASPNQGDEHDAEDAHQELLMETIKAKDGGGGAGTTAIVIASITTLGGIAVAVITMRRPKRQEHRSR